MKSEAARAAAMIKKFVKTLGIEVGAQSSNYSMGSSIHITVNDQPPEVAEKIKAFASSFQYGQFDGMQDLYEMNNNRADIPQAKFVFVSNRMGDVLRQEIWDFAKARFGDMDDAPTDAAAARNYYHKGFDLYCDEMIGRLYQGEFDNVFWLNALEGKAAA